jgi:hypothetical protein
MVLTVVTLHMARHSSSHLHSNRQPMVDTLSNIPRRYLLGLPHAPGEMSALHGPCAYHAPVVCESYKGPLTCSEGNGLAVR